MSFASGCRPLYPAWLRSVSPCTWRYGTTRWISTCIERVAEHVLSPDLYTAQFGNSHLLFTYPPFAALVFAVCGLHLGIWALQVMWGITNVVALAAFIYLSIRIVAPTLEQRVVLRRALLLLLPALALNPVFTTVGLGQINLLLCLLIIWDLATDRRIGSRTVPLGVATGLAAAIKLTPLIFVVYLLITRRTRGALHAIVTFIACETIAFIVTPGASWTYWTKYVFDSKRAGALLYSSDQNLSSALQRMHHGPVSSFVLVPLLVATGVGGLALAAWAHRRSSTVLGLLVCAVTGLIISPITWVHHMVWVVPMIIWLAAGADRPRRGPLLAGLSAVLFIAAPIWWVPTSWRVTNNPPELHQNGWQFLVGNSFFFAMLIFAVGVAAMLARRNGALLRGLPELRVIECRERVFTACPHDCADGCVDAAHRGPSVIAGATDPELVDSCEFVGSESSSANKGLDPPGHPPREERQPSSRTW